jgi:hypothetical protein
MKVAETRIFLLSSRRRPKENKRTPNLTYISKFMTAD